MFGNVKGVLRCYRLLTIDCIVIKSQPLYAGRAWKLCHKLVGPEGMARLIVKLSQPSMTGSVFLLTSDAQPNMTNHHQASQGKDSRSMSPHTVMGDEGRNDNRGVSEARGNLTTAETNRGFVRMPRRRQSLSTPTGTQRLILQSIQTALDMSFSSLASDSSEQGA